MTSIGFRSPRVYCFSSTLAYDAFDTIHFNIQSFNYFYVNAMCMALATHTNPPMQHLDTSNLELETELWRVMPSGTKKSLPLVPALICTKELQSPNVMTYLGYVGSRLGTFPLFELLI